MTALLIIFLLIGALLFLPSLRMLLDEIFKSPEQRAKENIRSKKLKDEGLQDKYARFLFGNSFVDNSKAVKAVKRQEETYKNTKKESAKRHGFKNVSDYEKATDPNRSLTKFNPKGKIGYGILSVNEGKGLKDSPKNRKKLEDLIIPVKTKSFRKKKKIAGWY